MRTVVRKLQRDFRLSTGQSMAVDRLEHEVGYFELKTLISTPIDLHWLQVPDSLYSSRVLKIPA